MIKITYALLCYPLANHSWLGILVGTDFQLVEKDIKSLKSSFSDYLLKQYKKQGDFPDGYLDAPKMKTIEVKIRPTYQEDRRTYPMPYSLKVPITAVLGDDDGTLQCYFPTLENRSFYCSDPKQFKTLSQYFVSHILSQKTPEEINRLFMYSQPVLEEVYLKVNYNRTTKWGDIGYQVPTTFLDRFAEKYPYSKTERRKLSTLPEAAWEMEHIVEEIANRIMNEQSNVLVVGEPSTGKSAVIKQAFRKLNTTVKKQKLELSFWGILPQRVIASSKYLGEWEEKCEGIIADLQRISGVLWVQDISRLLLIGGDEPQNSMAAFFSSYLRDNQLQMVGEVTPAQLDSMRRLLPGFVENFRIIHIQELTVSQVFKILDNFAAYASQNLKINITNNALQLLYRLLLRYYPYEKFPGKGVRFLTSILDEMRLQKRKRIGEKDVIQEFSKQTGLPEIFLRDDIKLNTEELKSWFNARIVGQESAIEKLCEVVKIYKAGLNNPHKPISTLLFAGPTGVGKTASAKALADYFFGKGQKTSPLIRIDMSEFRYPGQITQLLGAGKEVGKLVKEVRERPFAVLLLDEVEKADASIYDALMTVLDEGRMVDAYGRVTHFKNVIIIMTSNLGASHRSSLGFKDTEGAEVKYHSAIQGYFRPEFINRIDGVVMFNALKEKDIERITLKELDDFAAREGMVKNNIRLQYQPCIIQRIMQEGFNEKYGARFLQRAIESEITSPISNWLLEQGNIQNVTLQIGYKNNALDIEVV